MPQNSNFRLSRGHRFRPKLDFTVMAPNHGGDTLVSILGPMGSHLVKKMGQKQKKLPCPKIRIVHYTAVIDFAQNSTMVMVPYHGGDPLGSILGPMGSHWVQKMGQNRKKITMPKNSDCRLPRGRRFRPKLDFRVMAPNHGGDPLVSILGPMGSHWVQKMGQNHKKLPCPKIRIFDYPAVIDFGQNSTWRLWRQITVGSPRVHLRANGVPLRKIMGQNRKKLPCPKIRIFDYPGLIDFDQNSTVWLWCQITVGTP